MVDLTSLKTKLALIVNSLTKVLLAEISTAADKVSKNPETEVSYVANSC